MFDRGGYRTWPPALPLVLTLTLTTTSCTAPASAPPSPTTEGTVVTPSPPVEVRSIEISAPRTRLAPGETSQLSVLVLNENGRPCCTELIAFRSSREQVLIVDASGLVVAKRLGRSTITAEVLETSEAMRFSVVNQRPMTDRVDEIKGKQVHFVYAVPKGGVDRGLDRKGALANSIASFQRWLATQTGGRKLRIDTWKGSPDSWP